MVIKMIKVLHYYTQFNTGGTEKVIFSILHGLNKAKFDCYFLAQYSGTDDDKLKQIGVKVHYIQDSKNFEIELFNYLRQNHFDVIHVHNCQEMGKVLKIAKKVGIKMRIVHSHVARADLNKFFWILKAIKSYSAIKYANTYFACSDEAAKWLFPTKYNQRVIIRNGIDINRFKFNALKRESVRKKYGLNGYFVCCVVARLEKQKNISFLVKLIKKYYTNKKVKMLIVGSGTQENSLKRLVKKLNVDNQIIFLGKRENVEDFLSASDIFLFPSKYEGLGISAVEAQYNGLFVLASKNIPIVTDIGEKKIKYLPFNLLQWKKEIDKKMKSFKLFNRNVNSKIYDCRQIFKVIENEYNK